MTDATEMELRVAAALMERALDYQSPKWGEQAWQESTEGRAHYINMARAAIRAMRDPGHDLTAAVVRPGDDRTEAVRMWQAMIDAASPMKIIVPTPFRLRPEKEIPPRRKALAKPK